MAEGRTVWRAKDAGWWRRERIVELGQEFGPAGPAAVDLSIAHGGLSIAENLQALCGPCNRLKGARR